MLYFVEQYWWLKWLHCCLPLGGFPTRELPPQEQAKGPGALPPWEEGCRSARQHGRWPLHLRRPGRVWLWEQKEEQPSLLLHGWRRLRQHRGSSVPDVLNHNLPVLISGVQIIISKAKHLFENLCTFYFIRFHKIITVYTFKCSFELNHKTLPTPSWFLGQSSSRTKPLSGILPHHLWDLFYFVSCLNHTVIRMKAGVAGASEERNTYFCSNYDCLLFMQLH